MYIVLLNILNCEVSDGKRFILLLCLMEILISIFTVKYGRNEVGSGCATLVEEQK